MAKILTLTEAEAKAIRASILQSFHDQSGSDFVPVTYLGAYEDLRSLLLSKLTEVSGAESSISVHRLRKLFYYTDPAYCPVDKMESLSFGADFINLLNKAIDLDNTEDVPVSNEAILPASGSNKSKKTAFLLPSLISLLFLIGFVAYKYFLRAPYRFRDDFQYNSVAELKSRGWDFIDFDSSLFYPQDSGVLTLRSARGDYWVRPYDTPYINNVVYRELPNGCFEVTTKFTFPNNIEAFQQCGVMFLDKNKNRIHNIRMTYASAGVDEGISRGYQIVKRDHGEATQHVYPEITKRDTINYLFHFKIIKDKNQFSFYFHKNEESAAFNQIIVMKFDFEPRYVALVAFNGYRIFADGPLNTASSIPAKFDWVRVEGCK